MAIDRAGAGSYRWLPLAELLAVVVGDDANDRLIGGAVDLQSKTIALVRGDRTTLVAPFACFAPAGAGPKPEFDRLSFADYGLTVALGAYEASADAILYELDPLYRRRQNRHRRAHERGFGASLRRLRLQRGLGRDDFAPLASKTIARIERSEVAEPGGLTLARIARRLGVPAEEIESY